MERAPSQRTRTSVLARPRDTLSPCPQMELSAGFSPAWIRLEGGCLIYSSHESFEKWRAVPVLPRSHGVLEALLRCWRPAHDYAMAAAAGFAPTRTGSEPVMLLLHHAAVFRKWRTRRESHPHLSRRQRGTLLLSYESFFALPITRSQAEHVAATLHTENPRSGRSGEEDANQQP